MKKILLILLMNCVIINVVMPQQAATIQNDKQALLIIDIQNDYFTGGANPLSGSDKAAENARSIIDRFREKQQPVIFIQHIATRPGSTFFAEGTKGAEINDNVRPLKNEKIIVKHFPNSFLETELSEYLKKLDVKNLVICGMMTHMCVDATVRAAKDFGYNIILIGDACATRDLVIGGKTVKAEDVHNSFLAALNNYYADIKTTVQYLSGK